MMLLYRKILVLLAACLFLACSGATQPSTPVDTLKTYTKAIKQKDPTTMKLLLSQESLKMHHQEAKSQNVSLDEVVLRETLFSPSQNTLKYRNEKIEGDRATVEVENSFGVFETIQFVKEGDVWKIDKQSFANQIEQQILQDNQRLDEIINQGKQP
ncbi:MAG TPA: hypothetical protein VK892_21640 [Pyrinomonadaceae bacterium]|nr:hypothetical protein [Pyrinomonadaceae bacterium]